MSMSDQSSWFKKSAGASHPAVAFEAHGATIVGRIIDEPRVITTKDDFGNDVENLVVNLEAAAGTNIRSGKKAERQDVMVGDKVALWLKPGQIARAVQEAIRTAGADGLANGGLLAVQYYADGPAPTDPRKSAPKLYTGQYQPPVATVTLGLLGNAGQHKDDAPF